MTAQYECYQKIMQDPVNKQKVNMTILNAFDIVYKKTTRLHHCQSLRFLLKNELVASFLVYVQF